MADNRKRITQLQAQVADLEQRIKTLQDVTETTDNRFQAIEARRGEAQQLKNAIDTVKHQADALLVEIQQKGASATQLEDSIQGLVDSTEESKKTFEEHSKSLGEIEEKIAKFEATIIDQLGRAGSGALALAFAARQWEVEKELKRWRQLLFGSTITLAFIALGFFVYSFFIEITIQFFLKLTVSLPFIFAVYFSSRQYNKERSIVERYAFKAAQAKSLSAFSATVREMDSSEQGQAEAQKFVISSVEKIYAQPKLEKGESDFPMEKVLEIAEKIAKLQ
jgi:uncharacterized protein YoxC